ncbi:MAG: hypothetical protein KDC80_01215 [Saprospiraceae bacterium]|nr:hypothetical protein [Saprospiraceae bacterium]
MSSLDEDLYDLMQNQIPDSSVEDPNQDRLLDFMTERIEALMADQFETLMSMMYRLDVSEAKLRNALAPDNPENPARSLARLIIQRQKQRVATRDKYKQNSLDDWIDFE